MKTVLKQFKVYAPPVGKAKDISLNRDGTLTITGVASTTNQDLDGEIISEKALASLKDQAVGLNLHLDHNHDYDGGIGVITEAYVQDNTLVITANVLPDHAVGIRDRLKLGMNMGFSIGGIPIIKNSRSNLIDDFILLEISLTLLPANWDTFGTVETKGLVESTCLTGACYHMLKEKKVKQSESEDEDIPLDENEDEEDIDSKAKKSEDDDESSEDEIVEDINEEELEDKSLIMPSEKAQGKVIDDATKQELVNIVNEAIINLKPLILDELKEDMTKLVQDVVATSLGEVVPKALDGIREEVKSEIPVQPPVDEEVPVEDKDEEIPEPPAPIEEVKGDVPAPADRLIDEQKEVPEKVPLSGIPARKEDVGYANVANANPITAPTYTIDSKAVADAVIDEIWSKMDFKRLDKPESKLDGFRKSQVKSTKSKFLDNETRDKFGRNKKYL